MAISDTSNELTLTLYTAPAAPLCWQEIPDLKSAQNFGLERVIHHYQHDLFSIGLVTALPHSVVWQPKAKSI